MFWSHFAFVLCFCVYLKKQQHFYKDSHSVINLEKFPVWISKVRWLGVSPCCWVLTIFPPNKHVLTIILFFYVWHTHLPYAEWRASWLGLAWLGLAWLGLAWLGLVWLDLALCWQDTGREALWGTGASQDSHEDWGEGAGSSATSHGGTLRSDGRDLRWGEEEH